MPKHIGLDIGTSNTRMYMRGQGIIMRSPTVVAIDRRDEAVVAIGKEAKLMIGKTPSHIEAFRPIRDGVVTDLEVTAMMLHEHFKLTGALSLFNRPVVLVGAPNNCTEVERRALEDAIFEAGAKAVGIISSPIASAVGAGLNINSPKGCMVVDIGGGMTQVSVISSGGIVRSKAIKLGGDKIDNAIIASLKNRKDLYIGEFSAEMLKVRIGSALPNAKRGSVEVSGRNERLKCAQAIMVGCDDVYLAMSRAVEAICRTITGLLEITPPEIAGDISNYGIMLVGGGANMHGIAELINEKTRLRVTVAKSPMDCECIGLGRLIEKPSIIPGGILYKNR